MEEGQNGGLGAEDADGPVREGEMISPCLTALPMGFSWSLHFAQAAVSHLSQEADPRAELLHDGEPAPKMEQETVASGAYVDNLFSLSHPSLISFSLRIHEQYRLCHRQQAALRIV